MRELEELRAYLATVPSGDLSPPSAQRAESILAGCWGGLSGWDNGGMFAYKLSGRTEAMRWSPPILSFQIERHGAAVNGSIYAEMQTWRIDLSTGCASVAVSGRRQIGTRDAPLNVNLLAEDIAAAIERGANDERLEWQSPNRVRIKIGTIIPETNARTTSGRRRRFSAAIEMALASRGWKRFPHPSRHIFERT